MSLRRTVLRLLVPVRTIASMHIDSFYFHDHQGASARSQQKSACCATVAVLVQYRYQHKYHQSRGEVHSFDQAGIIKGSISHTTVILAKGLILGTWLSFLFLRSTFPPAHYKNEKHPQSMFPPFARFIRSRVVLQSSEAKFLRRRIGRTNPTTIRIRIHHHDPSSQHNNIYAMTYETEANHSKYLVRMKPPAIISNMRKIVLDLPRRRARADEIPLNLASQLWTSSSLRRYKSSLLVLL